ncbi:hypothetical protein ACJJTC_007629 [Scirpophaga incertulas]
MEDVHRRAIQSNFVSLVEQTDLDHMVAVLYEKGVFSERMIERYKDQRTDTRCRKRRLYMDVMLRGPDAFGHLTDALQEAGYWNLARDLDPNSTLHTRGPHISPNNSQRSEDNNFISISTQRKKTSGIEALKLAGEVKSQTLPEDSGDAHRIDVEPDPGTEIPHFHVKKCTKFYDDSETDIKSYRTRGPRGKRGMLLVFSYVEFKNDIEEYRQGVDVDCVKLKYLFTELGFRVLKYLNLTEEKTVATLQSLNEVLSGTECVFIVVSSHGYPRPGSSDVDFRLHHGELMSVYKFLEYFNNENLPDLIGVPKVFIFQICRGFNSEWHQLKMPTASDGSEAGGGTRTDGALVPRPPPRPPRARLYSDMLIAHSTLPGFVSRRDTARGSWYIQVVCDVFAAHAHDTHVEELFTLVDLRLAERFQVQTSSVDRWGFNRRLYLHPGLYGPS